jgi:hypothetical protein
MQTLEVIEPRVCEIIDAVRLAVRSQHRTMGMVGVTISRIIKAGRLLKAQRGEAAHGEWQAWIEANITEPTGLTYRTTRNWVKLAEAHDRGIPIETAQSVRQAYILAGLLPEPESTTASSAPQQSNYLVHISRLERTIKAQLNAQPIEQWSQADRQALRTRLKWIADLLDRL